MQGSSGCFVPVGLAPGAPEPVKGKTHGTRTHTDIKPQEEPSSRLCNKQAVVVLPGAGRDRSGTASRERRELRWLQVPFGFASVGDESGRSPARWLLWRLHQEPAAQL